MSYSTARLTTSHCLLNVPQSGWVVHVLQHCLARYKSLFVQRPLVGEWCTAWLTTSQCLFNVPQSGWVVHVLQQHGLAHYKSLFVQRPSEWVSGGSLRAALPGSLQVIVCSTSLRVGEWCKSYRSTAWLTTSHCLFNVPQSGWVVHVLQHCQAHYKSLFVQHPSEWVSGASLTAALPGSLQVIVQRPSEWVSGARLTALPGSLQVIVYSTSLRVGECCMSYSTAWLTTSHCLFHVPQSGWVVQGLQQHYLAHYKSLFVQRPSEWVSGACLTAALPGSLQVIVQRPSEWVSGARLTALPGSLQVIVCSTSLRVGEWCMSYSSTAWLTTSHCLFNVPQSGWVVHVLQHCLAHYKSLFVQHPSEWVSGACLTALPGSLQVIVCSTSLSVGEWCTAWLTTSQCLFNVPQSGWVVHVLQQHGLAHYKSLFVQRPSEWVSGGSLRAALPGSLQVIVCSTSLRVGEWCKSYSSTAWLTTSHCLFNVPKSGWVVHVLQQHCLAHYKSLFVQRPSEWVSGASLTGALPGSLRVIVCSTSLRVGEWCTSYSTARLTTSHCLFNIPQSGWVVQVLQQHCLAHCKSLFNVPQSGWVVHVLQHCQAHYKSLFTQRPSEWVCGACLTALPVSLQVIVCSTSLSVGEWCTAWLTTSQCLFNVPQSGWVVHVLQHCQAHYKSLFTQRPSEWVSGACLTALPGSLQVIVCSTSLSVGEWCTAWLTTSQCLFNVPQSGWVVHVLQQHGLAHYKSLFVQRPSEWVSGGSLRAALPGSLQVIVCSTSLRVGEWCKSYRSTAWLTSSHCLFNVPQSGWVVHVLQHCQAHYKSLFVQHPSEWVSGASLTAALPGSLQVIVQRPSEWVSGARLTALPGSLQVIVYSTSLRVGECCMSYSTAWLTTSHCLFHVPQSGWVVQGLQQHYLAHYKSLFVQRPSEWVSGACLTAALPGSLQVIVQRPSEWVSGARLTALPGSLQVIVCSTSLRVGEWCMSYSSTAWLTTSHCLFNVPQSGWVVHVLQHCLAHYKSLFVQHPSEWVSGACLTALPGSLQVIVCSTSLSVGEWCTAWLTTSQCLFNVPQSGWVVHVLQQHGLAHYKSLFVQRPSEWVSGGSLRAALPGSLQVIVCSTSLRVGEWCKSYSSTAWLTTSHCLFNVPKSGWVVHVLQQHCLAHYKSLFVQRPSEWVSGASLTGALPGSLRVIVCSTSLRVGEWCTSYSTARLTTSHCLFNIPQSGWVVQVLQQHCLAHCKSLFNVPQSGWVVHVLQHCQAHYKSLFTQRPSEWVCGACLTALPVSLQVIVCSTSLSVGEWCTAWLTTSQCLFNVPQSGWVVHVLQHCQAHYKSLFTQRPSEWVSGACLTALPGSLQVIVCSTSLSVGEWCTAWLTTSQCLFNVPQSGWVVHVLQQHGLAHYKSLFVQRPSEWVSGGSLRAALPGSLQVIVCSTSLRVGEWCKSYRSTAWLTTSHCLFNVPQSGWVVHVLQHCQAHYKSLFVQHPSEWVSGASLTAALPGSLQVIVQRPSEWVSGARLTALPGSLQVIVYSTSLRVGECCMSYSTAWLTTSHCLFHVPQSGWVVQGLQQHYLAHYKSLFVQRPSEWVSGACLTAALPGSLQVIVQRPSEWVSGARLTALPGSLQVIVCSTSLRVGEWCTAWLTRSHCLFNIPQSGWVVHVLQQHCLAHYKSLFAQRPSEWVSGARLTTLPGSLRVIVCSTSLRVGVWCKSYSTAWLTTSHC